MQASASPTACIVIIGNEVLSGRTQDKNLSHIAKTLGESGIRVAEARTIPDIESVIIETVNSCRKAHDYVFTTGGIGPTHDDITSASIAKAFGVRLIRHPEAAAILEKHYGAQQLNEARLKMADIPEGAALVPNPVSAAPGFKLENVFVLAGVPSIMQAMLAHIVPSLKGGAKIRSRTLSAYVTEGVIAEGLTAIQNRYPQVDIGSYPFIRNQRLGTSLVTRGTDETAITAAAAEIKQLLLSHTPEVSEEDLAA